MNYMSIVNGVNNGTKPHMRSFRFLCLRLMVGRLYWVRILMILCVCITICYKISWNVGCWCVVLVVGGGDHKRIMIVLCITFVVNRAILGSC